MNYIFVNCYLPSGKTFTQTLNASKQSKFSPPYLHKLDYKNNYVIIAGNFNLVINAVDRTGHFTPNTNDKILFQTILSNFNLIDSYRYLYPYSKTSLFPVPVLYTDSTVFIFLHS